MAQLTLMHCTFVKMLINRSFTYKIEKISRLDFVLHVFLQGIRLGSKALHLVTRQKKYIVGGILKLKNAMVNMRLLWTIQANLDLRNLFSS